MDLDKAIANRRSVRSFKEKSASWKQVIEAIDAAVQAPFAGNNNHLSFIVVEDSGMIRKIAEDSEQLWIQQAGIVVVVLGDDRHLEHLYGERGRIYGRHQAGAAIQNFLLKMTDLGLSACWVGSYDDDLMRSHLGIPSHLNIEAVIPVGYEKEKPKAKKVRKRKLDTIISWGVFGRSRRDFIFKEPAKHTTQLLFGRKK